MAYRADQHLETPSLQGLGAKFSTAAARLRAGLAATGRILTETCREVQIARMHAILAQMSDRQLEQIGAERDELRTHAERLIGAGHVPRRSME